MLSKEKLEYFEATANREIRNDLKEAVKLVGSKKIAIDCGCGAGSDIEFLRSKEFIVHGFDVEEESIKRCRKRFENDGHVHLSKDSFSSFKYPSATLVVADASLFFCPEGEFKSVWQKINDSLEPDGVFCGSFLGPEDTMASESYDKSAIWPDVLVLTEGQVKESFSGYNMVSFKEHKVSGVAPGGKPHDWHIYSVIAKKKSNKRN